MRSKQYAALVTSSAMFVAFGFYLGVSLLAAMYFGSSTIPLVTLNWENYTAIGVRPPLPPSLTRDAF